jgi:uncharacterized protein (TIGR01777 family)
MSIKVLISGGSGLVGSRLTELLKDQGFKVAWLVRKGSQSPLRQFFWNLKEGSIDPEATEWADHIIHLAGASVAEGRWTASRKEEIVSSRTESTKLLYNTLKNHPHQVKSFISASAMGFYGDTGDSLINESAPKGEGFLSHTVEVWEKEVVAIAQLGIREARIRIGIVLTPKGGALPEMMMPIKLGLGSALGSGKQYMSWIHIDDLCALFIESIKNEQYQGPINASTSQPITNKVFMKTLAKTMGKPFFMPSVPTFALKLILGEKAMIVTSGCRMDNQKLTDYGFYFQYDNLESAFENLLSPSPRERG